MIKACVIGSPIGHSRSPLIHGYWLKQHRIAGAYTRLPVEPEKLKDFFSNFAASGYAGCNVTIPHKENAFALVTPADDSTRRLGAVNTVYLREGRVLGTNTDGEGFINSLAQSNAALNLRGARAVILGAGGAATAVIDSLQLQGVAEISLVNRSFAKATQLRQRFGMKITAVEWSRRNDAIADCALLVNTTSLGMKGQPELEIDLSRLPLEALVTDIVYTPLRTKLLVDAASRGNAVVEGLGMLLHQAVRGFELWFGIRPTVTAELHNLIARDIDKGYRP